jgi:hypothetical protein
MPIQPTHLTQTVDLPYLCVNELNLSIMQKVSEIITKPDYKPFKPKNRKNAQTYTQYYVCNTPDTDHAFYYLQSINPISILLLEHSTFKISQSVMAVQKAYANLGYNSDGPINPILLHNEQYIEGIKPAVDVFVYELKSHWTSKIAKADRDKRISLINEIKKANARVMKKLFKTYLRFNLNHFTYVFNVKECTFLKDKIALEKALTQQMTSMINEFHENHRSEILALFFCVQRDLSDNYVLNIYCATELECPPLSMKDCITLRKDRYLIIAPNSNITLNIQEIDYKMDIQDVYGKNEKTWKSIFGQMVAKYNYVYYESEFVSPKFIYKEC